MENGSLDDLEGNTLHGTRDVIDTAEFHWSELARAPQNEPKGRGHYNMMEIFQPVTEEVSDA